jgi:hypothetical protein
MTLKSQLAAIRLNQSPSPTETYVAGAHLSMRRWMAVLDLPSDPDDLLVKVKAFEDDPEQLPLPYSAGCRQLRQWGVKTLRRATLRMSRPGFLPLSKTSAIVLSHPLAP